MNMNTVERLTEKVSAVTVAFFTAQKIIKLMKNVVKIIIIKIFYS